MGWLLCSNEEDRTNKWTNWMVWGMKILQNMNIFYFYDGFILIFLCFNFTLRESKSTANCHTKAAKPFQIYLYIWLMQMGSMYLICEKIQRNIYLLILWFLKISICFRISPWQRYEVRKQEWLMLLLQSAMKDVRINLTHF